jgi:hypothetical protein
MTRLIPFLIFLFTLAFVGWSQTEGYFNPPEVMSGLPLDKIGSNGWSGQMNKVEPLGGLAYPGDNVKFELLLTNTSKETLKTTPTIEICRFATRLVDLKDWWKPDFVNEYVGKPVRVTLAEMTIEPGKNVTIPWASKAKEFSDFGTYAVIIDIPGKGRQGVATFVRLHAANPKQGDGKK